MTEKRDMIAQSMHALAKHLDELDSSGTGVDTMQKFEYGAASASTGSHVGPTLGGVFQGPSEM